MGQCQEVDIKTKQSKILKNKDSALLKKWLISMLLFMVSYEQIFKQVKCAQT